MYGVGASIPELMTHHGYGAALATATISGTVVTGSQDREVVIQVTSLDGGDAVSSGDNAGTVDFIRWRTIDGLWHTLPGTTVDDYPVELPEEYQGMSVNVWVQVKGTAGFGQQFVSNVAVPGTRITIEDVVDDTIPVEDSGIPVYDEIGITIPPA